MASVKFILLIFVTSAITNITASANASMPRYVLRQYKRKEDVVLRLVDRRRHIDVWKCTFRFVHPPAFSQDHHALAMEVRGKNLPEWGLLLWREGEPARVLYKQIFFRDVDGIMDLAWSADKQRLLLRTWAGGGSIHSNNGEIWYLDIPHERFGFGVKGVRRMKWIGLRQVCYWKIVWTGEFPPSTERVSHVWTCP